MDWRLGWILISLLTVIHIIRHDWGLIRYWDRADMVLTTIAAVLGPLFWALLGIAEAYVFIRDKVQEWHDRD